MSVYEYSNEDINIMSTEDLMAISIDFIPKTVIKFQNQYDESQIVYTLYLSDRETSDGTDKGCNFMMSVINFGYLYVPLEIFDIDTNVDIKFPDGHIEQSSFYIIEDFTNDGAMMAELVREGYMPVEQGIISEEDQNKLYEYYINMYPIYLLGFNTAMDMLPCLLKNTNKTKGEIN